MLTRNKPPDWTLNVLIYTGFVLVGIGLFPILGWYNVPFMLGTYIIITTFLAAIS